MEEIFSIWEGWYRDVEVWWLEGCRYLILGELGEQRGFQRLSGTAGDPG
jgi:hypothetical protein